MPSVSASARKSFIDEQRCLLLHFLAKCSLSDRPGLDVRTGFWPESPMMLGEVVLPLVASMYVLGPLEQRADAAVVGIEDAMLDLRHVAARVDLDLSEAN